MTGRILVAAIVGLALCAPAAAADTVTKKTLHFDTIVGPNNDQHCDVIGDLYTPSSASKAHPAPAILATNGFGGSKNDQATWAQAYASRGYVVLSYSGLGFGGSGCKITLDDRDYDGKAGSQLVTFLGGGGKAKDGTVVDDVQLDDPARHDPRIGMIGGSYGGQIQYAIAGIDPRVDTIIPIITWNDLSYSLTPNNTSFFRGVSSQTAGLAKFQWASLFTTLGFVDGVQGTQTDPSRVVGQCPNFDDRACAAVVTSGATGAPPQSTVAFLRHASVGSFTDKIKIPTLLIQGQTDTLFNLQESVATYQALKAQGNDVKLVWMKGGHSGPGAPGEADLGKPDTNFLAQMALQWFDHYLKDDPAAPSLDFSYFRDWVSYSGMATPAYGRAPSYPTGHVQQWKLSGTNALTQGDVTSGAATFAVPAAGLPTSTSEISAVSQTIPIVDTPGTFAQFSTPPLAADTDVIGIPEATLHIDAPVQNVAGAVDPGLLALVAKVYDVAPDGSVTLQHRLVSPLRIADPTRPVTVQLPGIVHRFPAGHRIALVLAAGDSAYRGNNVPGVVTVRTSAADPGTLSLPVATAADQQAVVGPIAPKATCASRRSVKITLKRSLRGRATRVVVLVAGKRVKTLTGAKVRRAVTVTLKGRAKGTYTVTLRATLRGGRTASDVRRYKTCTKR